MNKGNSKIMRVGSLLAALLLVVAMAACGSTQPDLPGESSRQAGDIPHGTDAVQGETVSTGVLAASVQDKYESAETVRFTQPYYDVPKDQGFRIELGFDPLDLDVEDYTDMFNVYLDADMTIALHVDWSNDYTEYDESGRVFIELDPPSTYPNFGITPYVRDYTLGSTTYITDDETYLFWDEANPSWGELSQMYFVQYVDEETGERYDVPSATLIVFEERELAAPQVKFSTTEQGHAVLDWEPVPGADSYLIVDGNVFDGNLGYTATPIAWIAKTSWTADGDDSGMNFDFRTRNTTEDDKASKNYEDAEEFSQKWREELAEMIEAESGVAVDPDYRAEEQRIYMVVAINDSGVSTVSNLLFEHDIAPLLPYSLAFNTLKDGDGLEQTFTAEAIGLAPSHLPVLMCDGTIIYRILNYDIDAAYVEDFYGTEYLHIPYLVDSTTFSKSIRTTNFDRATYQKQLEALQQRQEDLRGRGGNASAVWEGEIETDSAAAAEQITTTGDVVFATSALSEYLAINMLAANTMIDLSEFPESADADYLFSAWYEACYQNPLILGVKSAGIVATQNVLVVEYADDAETIHRKQEEIRAKSREAVSEIITPDMSDLEKEIAINNYLCEIAEYDMAALENAEKNNFAYVDAAFEDSFTPYGVLVNGVGVCASYAGAFKILADEAGLDAVVVTGYLEGNLPHAWNRVLIDGEWKSVDTTNNDNPYLFNALLNLPDYAAELILVEDNKYIMPRTIDRYRSNDGSYEYYRIMDQYFPEDQIVTQLVDALRSDGSAVLRTGYDLSEEDFQRIAQAVMGELNVTDLYGFFWLGVINMSLETY